MKKLKPEGRKVFELVNKAKVILITTKLYSKEYEERFSPKQKKVLDQMLKDFNNIEDILIKNFDL